MLIHSKPCVMALLLLVLFLKNLMIPSVKNLNLGYLTHNIGFWLDGFIHTHIGPLKGPFQGTNLLDAGVMF